MVKAKNSSTSVTGVLKEGACFRATWRENDKPKSKRFSINRLGHEEAFRLACEYREQKIRELNEQGAGYTERHGK